MNKIYLSKKKKNKKTNYLTIKVQTSLTKFDTVALQNGDKFDKNTRL